MPFVFLAVLIQVWSFVLADESFVGISGDWSIKVEKGSRGSPRDLTTVYEIRADGLVTRFTDGRLLDQTNLDDRARRAVLGYVLSAIDAYQVQASSWVDVPKRVLSFSNGNATISISEVRGGGAGAFERDLTKIFTDGRSDATQFNHDLKDAVGASDDRIRIRPSRRKLFRTELKRSRRWMVTVCVKDENGVKCARLDSGGNVYTGASQSEIDAAISLLTPSRRQLITSDRDGIIELAEQAICDFSIVANRIEGSQRDHSTTRKVGVLSVLAPSISDEAESGIEVRDYDLDANPAFNRTCHDILKRLVDSVQEPGR